MLHALPYLIGFLVPGTVLAGVTMGGWFAFATPVVFFVITPILDECLPKAQYNASSDEEADRLTNPAYSLIVRTWMPVQVSVMVFVLWRLFSGDFSALETIGLVLSTGILGGTGITSTYTTLVLHLIPRFGRSNRAHSMPCLLLLF